jgi:adenylate kinase family enzyme
MVFIGKRINVVGVSGSGKTTFAERIAERLGVPHVEMDALYWQPNWGEPPLDEFRARVSDALKGDAWTIDGNYRKVRDIVWGRADTVVWLDFPFLLVLWRVVCRTFNRGIKGEVLWGTNRERLWENLFSKDSIIWWAITTYRRRKREYPVMFQQPQYAHVNFIRLHSQKEVDAWLISIGKKGETG